MSGIDIRRVEGVAPPVIPPAPFVELCVTTPFTFGRGASHSWELVTVAHGHEMDAIGVADRNTLAGAVRMHLHAKEAGLRALIGCRLVLEDAPDLVVYPRDRAAYGRLTRLLTLGKDRLRDAAPVPRARVHGKCRLWLDDLAGHAEGMALIAVPDGDLDGLERDLPQLTEALPGLGHLAVTHLRHGDDRARIGRLDAMACAHGLAILATSDVIYHHPSRRPLADVMACIDRRCTLPEAGRALDANAERHLKSPAEMARLFADWPHAVRASREIADAICFSLDDLSYCYPDEPVPPGRTADGHLADLTWKGAAQRYPDGVPRRVGAAIERELALIARLGYAHYFLTVNDIVAWARARGILCQGRGSAANSTVCFCLGVTSVDPAHHDLLIERFISENRGEPPDIDVDFEHERREEVIQYVYGRYGRHRAAIAATVIHYRPRMAIREVGRVMGLSEDVTAAIAKTVWGSWGTEIADRHMREAGLNPDDPQLRRTVALASELIGMPRHLSQHVGGFVLTQGPLIETVPTLWGAMPDRSFIEWDKDDLDAVGLMKVDVLALGMLTAIAKCFALLADHKGLEVDLASLPRGDEATYDMLCEADSLGVFQVESRAQMAMLPRLRPREFYDLVIEVAIVRPGPIQGDMVHPFLRRREGNEDVVYPAPAPEHGPPDELERILDRTLGVPVFQEQAMAIAMHAAEFTDIEANELRKAMATFRSRGTISALQDKMVGRMIDRGYDPVFARACFEQIKGFGEYGFPESHAASFAHLVYVSSWLKCHHPDVFCCALLNSQPMGFYAPAQIVRDAVEHGVEVLPADVNASDWDCTLEVAEDNARAMPPRHTSRRPPGGSMSTANPSAARPRPWYGPAADPPVRYAVRLGLRQIDGLDEASARRLTAAREGAPFEGVADAHARARLDRRAVQHLASADAFASCGLSRRQALWDARALRDAPDLPLFTGRTEGVVIDGDERVADAPGANGSSVDMPAASMAAGDAPPRPVPDEGPDEPFALDPMSASEEVVADYQTLRLSLKAHPLAFLREHYRAQPGVRAMTAAQINEVGHGRRASASGLVLIRQRPGSAKGVCFLTIEDETGIVNVVVWPKVMEANRRTVMASRLLRVEGRVQTNDRVTHLVADQLIDDSVLLQRLADPERAAEFAAGLDSQLARADHVRAPLPAHWQAPADRAHIPRRPDPAPAAAPDPSQGRRHHPQGARVPLNRGRRAQSGKGRAEARPADHSPWMRPPSLMPPLTRCSSWPIFSDRRWVTSMVACSAAFLALSAVRSAWPSSLATRVSTARSCTLNSSSSVRIRSTLGTSETMLCAKSPSAISPPSRYARADTRSSRAACAPCDRSSPTGVRPLARPGGPRHRSCFRTAARGSSLHTSGAGQPVSPERDSALPPRARHRAPP